MEKDLFGLNTKDPVVVKEEAVEGWDQDSAFSKGSGVQYPLSNTDAFDTTHKRLTGEMQMHPAANQPISVSMSNPFFKTHFAGGGQNFAGTTMKQQLLGRIPVTAPHSVLPSRGSITGTTEPWSCFKSSGSPQLTIFYAGMVQVYDGISPEKAQAIMFLAGNGLCAATNTGQPRAQVQVPPSKQAGGDCPLVNKPNNPPLCSGLSSPMSVSSHPVGQSGAGCSNEELAVRPMSGVSGTPVSKFDSPKIVTSLGPVAATTMISSAVPLARKASLTRFLEKRKERAMNSAPYNLCKKSPECATPGSNGPTSDLGAGSLSTKVSDHDV
ncbi:Protein TIFY 6B like isoform 2 [Actinidia chinensis var. chinensis]|uniref:Protein TIFY n=1 Tax=Actinidia chinensis var. chinensis TaxID=1590841 RepID=A0A2R6P3J9_ACTCC|nr:Protein TIFY 6B like isoform 2 [Actinidia chinensis var. chinensis]